MSKRILLLNQCFYPDHVATAQYLTDLALGLKEAGHEVTVVASSRGYDDPDRRYPVREEWRGIAIRRIWTPGLGKAAKWRRLVDFAIFWLNATFILLRLPRFDVTVCLTSPPLISTLGTVIAALKGGAVVPWVMDMNPDEAVAAGWLKQGGILESVLSALQRWSFKRAARIIALDRFMAKRIQAKGIAPEIIHTSPPWMHDDVVGYDALGREAFRAEHGLTDKFVVMYSGNHSPCHPLDTLLSAAKELAGDQRLHFLFVGGGSEMAKVRLYHVQHGLKNITTLPYQPLSRLAASLSAADLHTVVLGDPFVGIVHPCKVYNVLALGLPLLTIGPVESHLADLAAQLPGEAVTQVRHGETMRLVQHLQRLSGSEKRGLSEPMQQLAQNFSQRILRTSLVQLIDVA